MSQLTRKLAAAYEDLLREYYEYADPHHIEPFDLPAGQPKPHWRGLGVFSNDELTACFPLLDTAIVLHQRPDAEGVHVIHYELFDGRERVARDDVKTRRFATLKSTEFTPAKVVFYAGLHYQKRLAERRNDALRYYVDWLNQVKSARPDVYASFRTETDYNSQGEP